MEKKNLCLCSTEIIVAVAALEALEHNAVQSEWWMELGRKLKEASPQLYEALLADFPLETPIREWTAQFAARRGLDEIKTKCGVDTKKAKDEFLKGVKLMDKGKPEEAKHHFVNAKRELLDAVLKFCEEK